MVFDSSMVFDLSMESLVFDDNFRLSMEMGNNVSFHSKKEGRTSRPSPQGEDLSIGPLVYLFYCFSLFFSILPDTGYTIPKKLNQLYLKEEDEKREERID